MIDQSIKVIVFDLGGVLVDLGPHPLPPEWFPASNELTLSEWSQLEAAVNFEKGQVSVRELITTLKADMNISASYDDIVSAFTLWPKGLFKGVEDMLLKLTENYELAVLSNTNVLHWPRIIDEFKVQLYFDYLFASHLLKMSKPDLSVFAYVLEKMNVAPHEVLFLDDSLVNVAAARELGINAKQVIGFGEACEYLVEIEILEKL